MSKVGNKSTEEVKQAVGYAAAELVEEGMLVGLGTGSTATHFIERLIQRQQEGLKFETVATSTRSHQQAAAGGLMVHDMSDITSIDLTVDGADEIDDQKRMIKGGGGALLKEKIIASSSQEMVVIIDEGKLTKQLGAFPLPVEIVRFGARSTVARLEAKGYRGSIRQVDGAPFVTDEGHYILDIPFGTPLENPEATHREILGTVGVVETGFFFGLAGRVIVGYANGSVEIREG